MSRSRNSGARRAGERAFCLDAAEMRSPVPSAVHATAVLLCVVLLAPLAHAAEGGEEEPESRHQVGVFLGGAIADEHGHVEGGAVIGLNYQFRILPFLSLGLYGETLAGDLRDAVVLFPIILYPWRGLELVAGPGLQIESDLSTEFAIRLGLGYKFPLGPFEIGPEFDVDLVRGEPTYVFGVATSVGF
jgi:hypothetical protein